MTSPRRGRIRPARRIRHVIRFAPLVVAGALAMGLPGVAAAGPVKGPDVASWQHPGGAGIDWFAVRASGHQFAMVKATEGLNYVNPYFVQDGIGMRLAGMVRGAYHYADVRASPEAQAAFFAATAFPVVSGGLPPVLDLEDAKGLPPAAVIDWTRRYLRAVESLTGDKPIIYTYPHFWRTAMANTTEFSHYPLWIADYNGKNQPGPLPGGWSHWTFWQYTDSGRIPGVNAAIDLNIYGGGLGDINRFSNPFGS
ncbi:glycoside hydrolase family 25 protein [Rhodococcus sp. NPDC058505]|uniref:glycoside hydrolase family 25 protein n=1 Tax=Rhodococcus sp. NPDC058505 TaxID=3346531 RepID=UPI0036668167